MESTSSDLFYHESVIKCKDYMWNEKYSLAHDAVKARLHLPREKMEDIWIYMSVSLLTGLKEDRVVALKHVSELDKLIKQYSSDTKFETIIKENGKNDEISRLNWKTDLKLVSVEATFTRAMLQLRQGSVMKGALNLRSAWKAVQSLQKEIDASADKIHKQIKSQAKLFSSIFMVLVSMAPYFLQKILEFLGFVANRELGIAQLKECAEYGDGIKAPRAAMFLLMNYLFLPRGLSKPEDNIIPAEKLLSMMMVKYSSSAVFLWMQSSLYIKTGEIEKALECGKKALEACKELPCTPNSISANLAFNYYMARDFSEAAKILEQITQQKDSDFDLKGLCGLQLATCYYMLGDEKKAYAMLDKIPGLVSKTNQYDKIADKKAISVKKRGFGFTLFEVLYIRKDLHHLKPKDCNQMLELLEEQKKKQAMDVEHEAVYSLMKGVLKKGVGENQAAKDLFEKVTTFEKQVKEESWTVACANLELAEFAYYEGNLDKAEALFKKANSHTGGGYMELLHSRITTSLEIVKKEKLSKGLTYVEEEKKSDTKDLEDELKKASIDVEGELD